MLYKLLLIALCVSYSLRLVCSEQKTHYEQLNIEVQTPVNCAQEADVSIAVPEHNVMSDQHYVISLLKREENRHECICYSKTCCCVTAGCIGCIGTGGLCYMTVLPRAFSEWCDKEQSKIDKRKALHARLLAKHQL